MVGHLRYLRKVSPEPDAFTTALAALSADAWSAALTGSTDFTSKRVKPSDGNYAAFYTEPNYLAAGGISPSSGSTFHAFGSGAWVDSRKQYIMAGGGHDDDCDASVYRCDMPTLSWERTQDSCRYAQDTDANYASTAFGGDDSGAPFQSTDNLGWRAFPNASGDRGPAAGHSYASMCHLPVADIVWLNAGAAFEGGNGFPGGAWPIDAATGKFVATSDAWAAAPGGGINGVSYPITDQDGNERLFAVHAFGGAGDYDAYILDPATKTSHKIAGFFSVAPADRHVGCIVPDGSHQAYVCYRNDTTLAKYSPIELWPPSGGAITAVDYGNTKPAGVTNTSTWVYLDDLAKIVVFEPQVGIYTLDPATWQWSALIVDVTNLPTDFAGDTGYFKRFFHMPAYSDSTYAVFGLFHEARMEFHAIKLTKASL